MRYVRRPPMQYRHYPIRQTRLLLASPTRRTAVILRPVRKKGLTQNQKFALWIVVVVCLAIPLFHNIVSAVLNQTADDRRQTTTINATVSIQRIDQNSIAQYYSQADHDTWAPSDCSAASMTEVLEAYNVKTTLRDVLATEIHLHVISYNDGLLVPEGIDKTANAYGFNTVTLSNPTLQDLYSYTDKGEPVIVSFPPQTWTGGHILVVKGHVTQNGTNYVRLVDSSSLDMQSMKESTFLSYWQGFAKVVTPRASAAPSAPPGEHSVLGPPSISADTINAILCTAGSPACGKGQIIYDDGVATGINPAYALAFYHHESSYGLAGVARYSNSIGNLRCIDGTACIGGYAYFSSWEEGIQAWYALIENLYVKEWGLTTVEQIIPRYAPKVDNNNEVAYEAAVINDVQSWK